ncbi:hypothetical protein ACBE110449_19420 [Acinetobacter bereziniae]
MPCAAINIIGAFVVNKLLAVNVPNTDAPKASLSKFLSGCIFESSTLRLFITPSITNILVIFAFLYSFLDMDHPE